MLPGLGKDVSQLIIDRAAKDDQATVGSLRLVNKAMNHHMLMSPHCPLKPKLCHIIRVAIDNHIKNPGVVSTFLNLFQSKNESLTQLQHLLTFTLDHLNSNLTVEKLPPNSLLMVNSTNDKLKRLLKLSPRQLYMLFLVQAGFTNKNAVLQNCITNLENSMKQEYKEMTTEQFDALQYLINNSSEVEKSIYLKTCNLLTEKPTKKITR